MPRAKRSGDSDSEITAGELNEAGSAGAGSCALFGDWCSAGVFPTGTAVSGRTQAAAATPGRRDTGTGSRRIGRTSAFKFVRSISLSAAAVKGAAAVEAAAAVIAV